MSRRSGGLAAPAGPGEGVDRRSARPTPQPGPHRRLDPARDHLEIYRISAGLEFPGTAPGRWSSPCSARTACRRSPACSRPPASSRSGRRKRYDDTALLMAEIAAHGYDSPRGREAPARREPGPRPLRHLQRRHALRAVHVRLRPDRVAATVRLAPCTRTSAWPRSTTTARSAPAWASATSRPVTTSTPPSSATTRPTLRLLGHQPRVGEYTVGLFAAWFPASCAPPCGSASGACSTSPCCAPSASPRPRLGGQDGLGRPARPRRRRAAAPATPPLARASRSTTAPTPAIPGYSPVRPGRPDPSPGPPGRTPAPCLTGRPTTRGPPTQPTVPAPMQRRQGARTSQPWRTAPAPHRGRSDAGSDRVPARPAAAGTSGSRRAGSGTLLLDSGQRRAASSGPANPWD